MKNIDISHNKIVSETASNGFKAGLLLSLVPRLEERCEGITELMMYEDYIEDGFLHEGEWYYPFIVTDTSGTHAVWAKWRFGKRTFENGSPYSYIGDEDLEFTIAESVPEQFEDVFYSRSHAIYKDRVKLTVTTTAPDALLLVGKYSQSFVDEMSRQLLPLVEGAASVTGLKDSPIEFELVFGSGTYMEHTTGAVTYRRLLMIDGASRPRDFWVKWYVEGSDRAHSLREHLSGDEAIIFELAEDVPKKIREKEYRFLAGSNPSKYQSAMGKRNVTEWRDLIKRAVRRGELTRTISELEYIERESEDTAPVYDEELDIALRRAIGDDVVAPTEAVEVNDSYDDINAMLRMALLNSESTATGVDTEDDTAQSDEPIDFMLGEGLLLDLGEDYEAQEGEDENTLELNEDELNLPETEDEVNTPCEVNTTTEINEADIHNEPLDNTTLTDTEIKDSHPDLEEEETIPEEQVFTPTDSVEPTPPITEEDIEEEVIFTKEIKIVEENNDYEMRLREEARREFVEREARMRAEFERREAELRQREEALREENERLEELARESRERQDRLSREHMEYVESSRATEDRLRQEIEIRDRLEARERDRIAEAARQSIEEHKARAYEPEQIPEEPRAPETPSAIETEPAKTDNRTISKKVRIIFRTPVDYSVFGRIKSVIEQTVIDEGKSDVPIYMKAGLDGEGAINLNITSMPKAEEELLITIVKAIGNARIGVTKIILEDL